ncbi:MAG: DUF4397 domain-containing protein [Kiloniellales bacterium]
MKKVGILVCAGIAFGAAGSMLSAGATAADAYVVHGIPGNDLGLDPHLPVDISVDGACAFQDVRLGDILGPAPLEAGTYDVAITLADSANPCGGVLAVIDTVGISVAETAVLVANLDVNRAPRLSKFTTKTTPVDTDKARVTAYHTAAAPSVDLRVKPNGGGEVVAVIRGLENGEQSFPAELPAGAYLIRIFPSPARGAGSGHPVAEIPVDLGGGAAYALFAIGSVENETFEVVPLVIEPQS